MPAVMKKPAALKKPSAAAAVQRPAKAKFAAKKLKAKAVAKKHTVHVPSELKNLKGFIVNLERRSDRWTRVSKMLKKQTPWMDFEQFKASDGTQNPIPSSEIADIWSTENNLNYGDYFMWVHDAPGTAHDGTMWKWAADAPDEDDEQWLLKEESEDDFMYIRDAPSFEAARGSRKATAEDKKTGQKLKLRLELKNTGERLRMSGGERGCAHSHLRLWRMAAERAEHTLVLEDDVHLTFQRSNGKGKSDGSNFTRRLGLALKHAPSDFDVIYLGWSGWRGGNHYRWKRPYAEDAETMKIIRKAEYVWTTVAYVISPAGAKKLLEQAIPMNQPVDNFMAWEASQGRLNSYVALDEADDDGTWAGGIVDQFNFQGDTNIQKSDGGVQGDDAKDFAVDAA